MDDSDKVFDFLPTFSLEQNSKLLAQQVAQQVTVKIKQNSGGSILKKTSSTSADRTCLYLEWNRAVRHVFHQASACSFPF